MFNRFLKQWRERRERRKAMLWAVKLDGDDYSTVQRRELARWLARDRRRQDYLEEALQLQGMVAHALTTRSAATIALDPERGHPWPRWALAASAAIALVVVLLGSRNIQDSGYGQLSSVTMADGSRIELNSDSRIRISESDTIRQVELLEGEAYFIVAHDPQRPFVVLSKGRRITAVGTQFNVRTRGESTRVGVTEGRVVVQTSPGLFGRGAPQREEVGVDELVLCEQRNIEPLEAGAEQLKRETAWRDRRLVVDNRPLAEVIEELNHHVPYKLVLMGEQSRNQTVGGVFNLDDPDRIIRVISKRWNLRRVETVPYVVVLVGA